MVLDSPFSVDPTSSLNVNGVAFWVPGNQVSQLLGNISAGEITGASGVTYYPSLGASGYTEVVPVPEPAGITLLLVASIMLLLRKTRLRLCPRP